MIFQPKFHENAHVAKVNLGVQEHKSHKKVRSYMVVHWRRGDQLTTRCRKGKNGKAPVDQSYNCDSAKTLISEIERVLASGYIQGDKAHDFFWREKGNTQFRKHPEDPLPVVYISTNQDLRKVEDGKTFRQLFQEAGFKTFKDLGLDNANDLDEFTTELFMMVDSDFFMAWGTSSIHNFVKEVIYVHTLSYSMHLSRHKIHLLP